MIDGLIKNETVSYAIRQLLNKIPELQKVLFENENFKKLFRSICDENYFLTKAIFFNKPKKSNWFVGYHQD